MAREKIIESLEKIESLGTDNNKLVVQKSRPLFGLWRSELTLAEFKILDTYLARVDSHNPDKRVVVFKKGELEELLGVKRIRTEELDTRLKNLMTTIKIEDDTSKKGFSRISLFEKCHAEQDDYGQWQVEMMCTQSAMKYIFNIENIGYLRYKLRCISSLKSRQAYILFMFLELNRFRTPFKVELQELKEILGCDKEETYKEYKRFNDLVLKRIQKELNEKTECKFSYEPIKKGRSVVAVRFTVNTLPKASLEDIDSNQIILEDYEKREQPMYFAPLEVFNFSAEQLDEIQSYVATVPNYKLPQSAVCYDSIELMRYHYFDQKAREIVRRDKEKHINNKFSYLIKLIKEDCK